MNPTVTWMNAPAITTPAWPGSPRAPTAGPAVRPAAISTTATPIRYARAQRGQTTARDGDHRQRQQHHDGFQDQRARHDPAEALPRIRWRGGGVVGLARSFRVPAEQRPRCARGDHRAGDHHAAAGEPVVLAGLLDQRGRGLDGIGQRRGGDHALRAEALLGAQRRAPRRPSRAATRCGSPRSGRTPARVRRGCRRRPCPTSPRRHPTESGSRTRVCNAVASAAAPAGLCAASMNTVGALRIRSSRPGLATDAKPARTASTSS